MQISLILNLQNWSRFYGSLPTQFAESPLNRQIILTITYNLLFMFHDALESYYCALPVGTKKLTCPDLTV